MCRASVNVGRAAGNRTLSRKNLVGYRLGSSRARWTCEPDRAPPILPRIREAVYHGDSGSPLARGAVSQPGKELHLPLDLGDDAGRVRPPDHHARLAEAQRQPPPIAAPVLRPAARSEPPAPAAASVAKRANPAETGGSRRLLLGRVAGIIGISLGEDEQRGRGRADQGTRMWRDEARPGIIVRRVRAVARAIASRRHGGTRSSRPSRPDCAPVEPDKDVQRQYRHQGDAIIEMVVVRAAMMIGPGAAGVCASTVDQPPARGCRCRCAGSATRRQASRASSDALDAPASQPAQADREHRGQHDRRHRSTWRSAPSPNEVDRVDRQRQGRSIARGATFLAPEVAAQRHEGGPVTVSR